MVLRRAASGAQVPVRGRRAAAEHKQPARADDAPHRLVVESEGGAQHSLFRPLSPALHAS